MAGEIFENANQVFRYIVDKLHCQVSYNTVKKAIEDGKITKRRGRGFTLAAVEAYARTLDKKISAASPKDDLPLTGDNEAPLAKTKAEAKLKQVQAERAQFLLNKERGKFIPTTVMEAELGQRAKAFKLGLEKFAPDNAVKVAEIFGGAEDTARELCNRLGADPDAGIPLVIDFTHSRIEHFTRMWRRQVLQFLDSYATGTWWTEEMQQAWEKMLEAEENEDAA
ncbi:hypothetical protein [Halodesulfovibrio aestuarii]|uniref:hypothetical protein n=1 Tax=Halodesulfovibrio aestuarii TaxID=126333 RepID=UPI0003765F0B|nr:hypothetical protein [Halodesulfovibrio aestuarii]